uniref:Anthrone oxygenase ptaC n=2 Tax=Pestalotiopsis fici (strain W106-1 / CGMCC3.15140) TaxID=1229662 RepID=PTAC_PESFW|nr:RecName: Full=Anthrone oxygenase ptaC; AltName: Full=Pestheic acid biosynthesis cluster protein C; Flags: Precursor [Pestalotiopsis fici W106-1]AGO59043.1 PtaC [Pestalotiopsis fici]
MMGLPLMAVPMLLDTGADPVYLARQWARMYYYGVRTMPPLAITTFILYVWTIIRRRSQHQAWYILAVAAVVTMGMIPFTWYVLAPTNNALFRLAEGPEAASGTTAGSLEEVTELLVRWNKLHIARSLFPLTGVVIALSDAM